MENNNEILNKINSGEPGLLAAAVQEIKENGDLNIAETLLHHLAQIQEPHVVTVVVNLLADIKDNNFREILIRQIRETTNPEIRSELLRIVWESSLDYSAYLDVFLNILQGDDFMPAFEASTVVENMVHNLSEEQHRELHELIHSFPADKQFLIENIHDEMNRCNEERDEQSV